MGEDVYSIGQSESLSNELPRFPPGLEPPPGTPSHGSVLHMCGSCHPCPFFWDPPGCSKGMDCMYCHDASHETDVKTDQKVNCLMMRFGLMTPKLAKKKGRPAKFCTEMEEIDNLCSSEPS